MLAGFLFISGVLLLYTAIMAPVQIFLWEFDETKCNTFPTLYFDLGVDIFFLVTHSSSKYLYFIVDSAMKIISLSPLTYCSGHEQLEIVVQFCTGSLDVSETYCDDYRVIAVKYLSSLSGFWFDFATSLPWSFNDLYAYQVFTFPAWSLTSGVFLFLLFPYNLIKPSVKCLTNATVNAQEVL